MVSDFVRMYRLLMPVKSLFNIAKFPKTKTNRRIAPIFELKIEQAGLHTCAKQNLDR
jgi:hypothetical protein